MLLIAVVASYRQVVRAYPSGGGDYEVAIEEPSAGSPALVVASALLVDYVLTVAVSVSSGVDNIISAFPSLNRHRVLIARRPGRAAGRGQPARPARVGQGVRRPDLPVRGRRADHDRHRAGPASSFGDAAGRRERALRRSSPSPGTRTSTGLALLFFALRAFSSGCTALTGVEAIANGVPAFRPPKSRNAADHAGADGRHRGHDVRRRHRAGPDRGRARTPRTPATCRASRQLRRPTRSARSSPSSAAAIFGGDHSVGFFYIQAATALILVLAANTAFNGFPLLGSVLAQDRYLPRQLHTRGDRLRLQQRHPAAGRRSPALLIVVFHADVTRLIQLYIIGVFTSFTLGQCGHGAALEPGAAHRARPGGAAPDAPLAGHQRDRRHR